MSTITKPLNAIAVEVERMRSNIGDLDIQIETLQERRSAIVASILELEPLSTWETIEIEDAEPIIPTEPISN